MDLKADLPGEANQGWDWQADSEFLAQLTADLRRLAVARLRAGVRDLSVSSLVQESLVRLLNSGNLDSAQNRSYIYAAAARAMRFVVVDHVRATSAEKRNHRTESIVLARVVDTLHRSHIDILMLDEALTELARSSERRAAVVELKFFGSLTMPEIATSLHVSLATVEADWAAARKWLFGFLCEDVSR